MADYVPPEPFNAFYEVVTVGRKWHLFADVKIYYISESRSKSTLEIFLQFTKHYVVRFPRIQLSYLLLFTTL